MGRPRLSQLSQVPATTSPVRFFDITTNRDGLTIHNNSLNNLFLALADTVSTTTFTVKMIPDSYYEVPWRWQGEVWGVWDGTDGDAQCTEFFD